MRVLFFGTSDFAVPTLRALAAAGAERFEIAAVVTQPDRPAGRGRALARSPVKDAAEGLGLPVRQPERVRDPDFLEAAREAAPDAIVLASFGQIIPRKLLALPPLGPINLHGSLLPAYRGAAPIQYALLDGCEHTGVTTMWMAPALDAGDILLQRRVPVEPNDNAGTLAGRVAEAGAPLMLETLDRLAAGNCPRAPQDDSRATYAPSIGPGEAEIRWQEPAARCRNRVRAMAPRPGAHTRVAGRRLKVWRASMEAGEAEPGFVARVGRDGVAVGTGGGLLLLEEVQPENGRAMPAGAWARGARLAPGDRLGA